MAVRFLNMVLPFFAALLRDVNEQWRKYYDIDYAKSNIWRNILRSLSGCPISFSLSNRARGDKLKLIEQDKA